MCKQRATSLFTPFYPQALFGEKERMLGLRKTCTIKVALLSVLLLGSSCMSMESGHTTDREDRASDNDGKSGQALHLSDAEIMARYWDVCRKLNLDPQDPLSVKELGTPRIGDSYMQRGGTQIMFVEGPVHMGIDCSSGLIRIISNGLPLLRGNDSEPTVPTWTREEAENKAREILTKAVGRLPWDLRLFTVEFRSTSRRWEVCWRRAKNGIPWLDDGIQVSMYEKGGLISFGIHCYSQDFEPDTGKVRITEKQAIEIATASAGQIVRKFGHRGEWFDGYMIAGLWQFPPGQKDAFGNPSRACGLLVVNPNYILDDKRSLWRKECAQETWGPGEGTECRLAYVVMFKASYKDEMAGADFFQEPVPVNVYIDAESGEVLGGCF